MSRLSCGFPIWRLLQWAAKAAAAQALVICFGKSGVARISYLQPNTSRLIGLGRTDLEARSSHKRSRAQANKGYQGQLGDDQCHDSRSAQVGPFAVCHVCFPG